MLRKVQLSLATITQHSTGKEPVRSTWIITEGCLSVPLGYGCEQCVSNTIYFKKIPSKGTFLFVCTLEKIRMETHQILIVAAPKDSE